MGLASVRAARAPWWASPPWQRLRWSLAARLLALRVRHFAAISSPSSFDDDEVEAPPGHLADVPTVPPSDARAQQVFESLYSEQVVKITAYCLRLTGNREVAEDLAQDVFVYAWERRDVLLTHPSPIRWLFGVTSHKSIDYLRRQRLWERLSRLLLPLLRWHTDALERQVEARDRLTQAVQRLSPTLRQTWLLREAQGFTRHEVAQILGQKEETISKQLYRARELLTAWVGEDGRAPQEAPGEPS